MSLNVGGHVSLGRKPMETVRSLADGGFGCMQTFASSPGAWKPPIVDEQVADCFVRSRAEWGIDPVFLHAIYLINLASADEALVRRSVASLVAAVKAGARYGAAGVVTHIGSHAGRGYEAVADEIVANLHAILAATEDADSVDLVLESSAGAGGIIGADLRELGDLIARVGRHPRLKVALDTAHLCGSGWDFREPCEANKLVETVEREIGIDRLVVVHANDSAQPPGSRKDRHANIGEGYIGREGFAALLAQPALTDVPWILETPNLDWRVEDRLLLVSLLPTCSSAVREVGVGGS